ncbi:unnamed protein product [[Candida] boidinii]|uniref:Unnamed protein product n=1 Tax=Candida boidinii TaxID=5477 RepID=A0A9W6T370_CANBO|nr:unnamed protein product [[Candida] boidinii]
MNTDQSPDTAINENDTTANGINDEIGKDEIYDNNLNINGNQSQLEQQNDQDTSINQSDTQITSIAPTIASASASAPAPASSISNNPAKTIVKTYASRTHQYIETTENLKIQIVEATRTNESHSHISFIVYSIKVGNSIVKRRYSEFENLRKCLIKLFPVNIIPPIPDKQSLKSNLTETTTTSLGLKSSSSSSSDQNLISTNNNNHINNSNNDITTHRNYIEQRKRMLAVFLNRCLRIPKIKQCFLFISFLDPESNFNDYLTSKEGLELTKTSIYRLNPFDPLKNIQNQIYLTLPNPNSFSLLHSNNPSTNSNNNENIMSESDLIQLEMFQKFELKFKRYESVLNNISKINKRITKTLSEIVPDLTDLGSQFSSLSLIQDSTSIERMGKVFDRNYLFLNSLSDLISLKFLDKILELKNFAKTAKELMEYNKNKMIQLYMIESNYNKKKNEIKIFQQQDENIRKIDNITDRITGQRGPYSLQNQNEPPITDEELQASLYVKAQTKQTYIGKILPGINKFNNLVSSITDSNPVEKRKKDIYDLKMRVYQLQRQKFFVENDNKKINSYVLDELERFHDWFKKDLESLVNEYNIYLLEFIHKNVEAWEECYNQ